MAQDSAPALTIPPAIVGVDFSGARADRNTWVARARLAADGGLRMLAAQRARRAELYELLTSLPTPAVVALDFPFGVPRAFADWLAAGPVSGPMPAVWRMAQELELDDFITRRNDFVASRAALPAAALPAEPLPAREREPKRAGDRKYHPESYSPLHVVNPNMMPMTYHGMRLLHALTQADPARWRIPPLPSPSSPAGGGTVTLLELMPGALLRSLGLPFKGYKRGRHSERLRAEILDSLTAAAGFGSVSLDSVRADCLANDDCLDAVMAAVGAALWAQNPAQFRHPQADELADAQLEGWIYVPRPREAAR